ASASSKPLQLLVRTARHTALGTTAIYLNLTDMHVVDEYAQSFIEPFRGDMQKPPNRLLSRDALSVSKSSIQRGLDLPGLLRSIILPMNALPPGGLRGQGPNRPKSDFLPSDIRTPAGSAGVVDPDSTTGRHDVAV